ncbi:hypothetical protein [Gordonia sp. NB41Y]|uniref:hypothetical protein n=1 Tax=Gordonia sp. NB41Y TaxID=875808 RepID=UPI0002BF337E|nr:hypothetical protein [Gordonia sp. NB41Y]EMP15065.1 hypothetical protein ISGA_46 [Gordonia sp. NB41Y]WLP91338.1 hypothetical protein Q9K23_03440 [Gordonia sp. NB41Y]
MTDTRDQPTWARIRHGAGCALPTRLEDGTIGVLPVSVPTRLVFSHIDDDGYAVWFIPAGMWSPGDTVEIGPVPADVRVEYEIDPTNELEEIG